MKPKSINLNTLHIDERTDKSNILGLSIPEEGPRSVLVPLISYEVIYLRQIIFVDFYLIH